MFFSQNLKSTLLCILLVSLSYATAGQPARRDANFPEDGTGSNGVPGTYNRERSLNDSTSGTGQLSPGTEWQAGSVFVAPVLSADLLFLHFKETGPQPAFSLLHYDPSFTVSPGVSFLVPVGKKGNTAFNPEFFFVRSYFRGESVEEESGGILVYSEMLTKLTSAKASLSLRHIYTSGNCHPYVFGGIAYMYQFSQVNRVLVEVRQDDFINTYETYTLAINRHLLGPVLGAGVIYPLFRKKLPFFLDMTWEYLPGLSALQGNDRTLRTQLHTLRIRTGIYFNAY